MIRAITNHNSVQNHLSYSKNKSERSLRWLYSGLAIIPLFPIIVAIFVLFAGVLTSGVCSASNDSSEVHVGSELDFPPYAFTDKGGNVTGFSIDLIKSVSDAMGLSIKISTGTWDNVWGALVAGKLDVLPIVAKAPQRIGLVEFSLPHTETFDSFFVRKGDPPIKDIASAMGMDIVVMRSDAAHHELLAHHFQGNLVLVDTIAEGLLLVSSGKHNAVLCSKLIGTLLIKKNGVKGLIVGPPIPDYKRVFSFAVKKGDIELLEKLNQGLLIVKTNGEYDRVYDKWLTGDDPWRRMRKYILPAVIVVLSVLLVAGIWLVTLHRVIRIRNSELALRKQAEKALQESESKYRLLFENMVNGFALHEIVLDQQGEPEDYVFLEVNSAFEEMTGLLGENIIGEKVTQVLTGIDKDPGDWIGRYGKIALTSQEERFEQYSTPLGKWFDVLAFSPQKGRFATIFSDVSQRKQVEFALEDERERLAVTLRSIGDGVITTDLNGKVVLINRVSEELTGWSQDEACGLPLADVFHIINEHTRERCESPVDVVLRTGTVVGLANDTLLVSRDGTERVIADSGAPIRGTDNEITGVVLVFRDITKKIELERDLQQARKMESIGNLAGGIAHDFNNILSAIIGFTELALDETPKGTALEDSLQEVYSAGKRARDLVKQILTFARKSDEKRYPIQPGAIVKEVLSFIRSTIPTSIEIRHSIESDSWIMGNALHVHQILVNLCSNAASAMGETGGVLEVGLKDVAIDWGDLSTDIKPGDYVEIRVSDTGVGIAPEIIGSIFEPYFTTKEPGEGTGMGLALVHGIVESYGGRIKVDSRLGKSTVFTVHLPITRMRSELHEYVHESLPTGTEQILLVDDEVPIAKMGSRMLEGLGYRVTTMTDCVGALELFKARPSDFDLVVTDMTMPNMTGDKLAIELMKIRPDIPVILCTGYSKKISDETASDIGIKAFAYKPVVKADLAKTVRKVLDAGRSEA